MRLTSWQDPYHVTVPNKIDTRERDMICVICFNLVKNIKDQLSMQPVFGNLDNLVINHNNRWDLYWSHPADNDEIMDGSWYQRPTTGYWLRGSTKGQIFVWHTNSFFSGPKYYPNSRILNPMRTARRLRAANEISGFLVTH
jgi:hypothetical protein